MMDHILEMKVKIFSIVVTFNGATIIEDCLSSLLKSNYPLEIIVVDNASTDDTPDIVNKHPDIIFLPQEKNVGFGQANNIGIHYALDHGADFVFLLNQDAIITCDTIDILVRVAQGHPEMGIISPLHLNADGSEIDPNVVTYLMKWNPSILSDLYFNRNQVIYPIHFINAAAWLISADCVRKVGGFDDLFFMYGEDHDYINRALMSGFKIGIVPGSVIFHKRINTASMSNKWNNLLRASRHQASLINVQLKISEKPFFMAVMIWRINHLSQKCIAFLNGQFVDVLSLLITGTMVLFNLLETYIHKRRSLQQPAFWRE